jgi:prepilin-type N-terminal cleavage/methylation domain-containing protein
MPRTRPAYTLIEVLVVMAIILVLGAISVSSYKLMYADHGTLSDSDMVRAQWALARKCAIDYHVPYVFGVVWDDGTWRIAPEGDGWEAGAPPVSNGSDGPPSYVGGLRGGSRFVQASDTDLSDGPASPPDPSTVDVGNYFQLVTFYPDGSIQCQLPDGSSPEVLELYLQGATRGRLIISLRAITAVSSIAWEQ